MLAAATPPWACARALATSGGLQGKLVCICGPALLVVWWLRRPKQHRKHNALPRADPKWPSSPSLLPYYSCHLPAPPLSLCRRTAVLGLALFTQYWCAAGLRCRAFNCPAVRCRFASLNSAQHKMKCHFAKTFAAIFATRSAGTGTRCPTACRWRCSPPRSLAWTPRCAPPRTSRQALPAF